MLSGTEEYITVDTKELENLTDIAEHLRSRLTEAINLMSEIISSLHKDSLWDSIGNKYIDEYVKSIGDLERIEALICETEKVLRSLMESFQCFSAPVFPISKHEKIVEKAETSLEDVESLKNILEGIEAVDDDDLAALEAVREESRNISESLAAESAGEIEYSRPLSSSTDNCEKEADSMSMSGGDILGIQVPSGKLAGGIQHCRVCDNSLTYGANFCPYCGSKVTLDKADVDLKKVQFSAVAPKTFIKGDYTVINIVMYENPFRHVVDELLNTVENPMQETTSGVLKVHNGSNVKIILSSPDMEINDNEETQSWQGDYLSFSFAIVLPEQYKKRQILFNANVYINDVIATKLKFIAKCSSILEQKISVTREDVLSAFVSYASQDRNRVAAIIQGMKKARPDMDVFFDVDSKWVDAEWRYAFKKKGADCIEPVPIEPPDICPPPKELSHKHFNDKLLYIINANSDNTHNLNYGNL